MNFAKTYTLESEIVPGLVVTLKRIGPKQRGEIELKLADARSRQRELRMKYASLKERLDRRLTQDEDVRKKLIELQKENTIIGMATLAKADLPQDIEDLANEVQATVDALVAINNSEIQPVFLKAGVKAFNSELTYGDEENPEPATVDLLCEVGPDELFDEIARAVNEGVYVDPETAGNLQSPTTSGAQMDGQTSTVPSANDSASGDPATANSSTPTA